MKRNRLVERYRIYLLPFLALMCILSVSCSDEEQNVVTPKKLPLLLNTTLTPLESPATTTRATPGNRWRTEDRIAIEVEGDGVKKYNPTVGVGDGDSFYWKKADEVKNVTAWYPFSEEKPATFTIKVNQRDGENEAYNQSDFLWGSAEFTYKKGFHSLALKHRVAKVVATLTAEPGISLDGVTVYVWGYSTANVNPLDGSLTPAEGDTKEWITATTSHNVLLIPDAVGTTNEPFIRIKIADGYSYIYQTDEAKKSTLKGGTAYTYEIKITREKLIVEVVGTPPSGDWVPGENTEEEVESTTEEVVLPTPEEEQQP